MTEIQLKEYKNYLRIRIKNLQCLINQLCPNNTEDNLDTISCMNNCVEDINKAISFIKHNETHTIKKELDKSINCY